MLYACSAVILARTRTSLSVLESQDPRLVLGEGLYLAWKTLCDADDGYREGIDYSRLPRTPSATDYGVVWDR